MSIVRLRGRNVSASSFVNLKSAVWGFGRTANQLSVIFFNWKKSWLLMTVVIKDFSLNVRE